jgi:hypothetical protein
MGGIRRRKALLAWIAVFALLGNMAASLLCVTLAKSPAESALDLALSVICTEHGPQKLPGGDAPPKAPDHPCAVCLTAGTVAILVAAALTSWLIAWSNRPHIAWRLPPLIVIRPPRAGHGSRAPPLPA